MANAPQILEKPMEVVSETIEASARDVKKQVTGGWDKNFAQMLVGGKEAYKTPEEIKQIELRERMMKEPLFKQRLEELAKLKKNNTTEIPDPETGQPTITEIPNPYTKKEEEELISDFREIDRDLKAEVSQMGVPQQNAEEQQKQRKKQEDQQKEDQDKAIKEQSMNETIEVQGKSTGGMVRKKSPPRMKKPPKTSENKAGGGIGG